MLASLAPRAMRAGWVGGIVLALGLVGTAVWALSTRRLYQSEAVVVYERGVQSVSDPSQGDSPKQVSSRLADMVTSRQRLEVLIKEMNLYPGIIDQRGTVEAIEEMRKHLKVTGREGYNYRVSYDADKRELAQSVLDRLLKQVIDEDNQRRVKEAEDAKAFLDNERKNAEEDLRAKNQSLTAFLAQHPVLANQIGPTGGGPGSVFRDVNAGSGAEIASLELQAAQIQDQLLRAGQRPTVRGEAPIDPMIAAARSQAYAELQAAKADLALKQGQFTDEHPDVRSARRRIADAEATLRRSDKAMVEARSNAPPPPVVERSEGEDMQVGALQRALSAVRSQLALARSRSAPHANLPREKNAAVATDAEFTRLSREASEARTRQSQIEAKQFQAQLLATLIAAGQGGKLVIADPPFKPMRPIAGGRFKIALVGGAASLMLAFLAIAIMALFDDRLYGSRDVERMVPDAFVVHVPRLTEKGG